MNYKDFAAVKKIFTKYLEEKKLRKTPERFIILEDIYNRTDHFDADALFISIKNSDYKISRATVYNTLDLLVDCNLVSQHQFGGNKKQYEKAYGFRQHDHLICYECNKVIEFCDPRVRNIQKMVEEIFNFKIAKHSLNFYGECLNANCEGKKNMNKL